MKREWWAVSVVVLLAFLLRAWQLTAGGLNLDEGYSLLQSERGFFEIIELGKFDAHPPLYFLILHVWRSVLGWGEFAAKLLSLIVGVAGVLGIILAAKARFGLVPALFAGLVAATNPFHVLYSQEVRGYALIVAAVAFADWLFVRWDRQRTRRNIVLWAVVSFVAVQTHHFAWYFVLLHGITYLLSRDTVGSRKPVLLAVGGVILASVPALIMFVILLTVYKPQVWIKTPAIDKVWITAIELGGHGDNGAVVWGLALVGLASCFVASKFRTRLKGFEFSTANWRDFGVPGLMILLPLLAFVGSKLAFPMYVHRYFLMCLLPLAVLAAGGVRFLRNPWAQGGALVALLVLSWSPLHEYYRMERAGAIMEEEARFVADQYRSGDVIVHLDKLTYTPFAAIHSSDMDEFIIMPLEGRNYSTILKYYVGRRLERDPPRKGEYGRVWYVTPFGRRPQRTEWLDALWPDMKLVDQGTYYHLFEVR